MNGALAFVDTSDCTMMNIAEHYTASDVEWDPTGRYIVTSVSWWSHKVAPLSGFVLWGFLCCFLLPEVLEEKMDTCHWSCNLKPAA